MTRKKLSLIACLTLAVAGGVVVWWFFGDMIASETNHDRVAAAVPDTGPASRWAEPIKCEGVGNFHRVSPILYRGDQPTKEGFENLAKMGIKMVISLRQYHGDSKYIDDLPLKYRRIRFNAWSPDDEDVAEFLRLISDPANHPVFLHCKHGADRTGMMCAIYRVQFDGWTRSQAVEEWTKGGFGFHSMFQNLLKYFRELDIKSLLPPASSSQPGAADNVQTSSPKRALRRAA